jgi:hypothetical protein
MSGASDIPGWDEVTNALDRISSSTGMQYFDRQGKQITMRQWMETFEDRETYGRVAWTDVDGIEISTVWLGLDHNFARAQHPELPPLIFETMVFGGVMDQEPYRWATEQEALEGHEIAVAAVRLQTGQDKA